MTQNFLNTTTHNVAWIHKRLVADELQLKAPFQRNPVWTTKQKSFLIDTILRGYPIPELYMQEFTDGDGNDIYVVVDGQQRIRACEEFIHGSFKINRDDTPEWADMKFDDLSEADRKKIYNYNFVVRTLPDLLEQELRSMFGRLNRNTVALKPQELRHARTGESSFRAWSCSQTTTTGLYSVFSVPMTYVECLMLNSLANLRSGFFMAYRIKRIRLMTGIRRTRKNLMTETPSSLFFRMYLEN